MTLPGAEQDADVGRSGRTPDAGDAIAHRDRGEDSDDLVSDGVGRRTGRFAGNQCNRKVVDLDGRLRRHRKSIAFVVPEAVTATWRLLDVVEHIVDEREQLGDRAKAR